MTSENTPSAGLDFGTSTTLVASARGVLPIGETYAWMPSLVGYDEDGATVVGEAALELDDERIVRSIKRFITENRGFVSMETPTGVRDVRADELMAQMLGETLRRAAERGLDLAPGAMLGCPAMWDGKQRRRLQELAQRAGLRVTLASLVDEPVAAGIAWLSQRRGQAELPRRVLVFDMGGGTLDIAVLQVRGDNDFAVLAALGVNEAGNALDDALAEDLEYVLAAQGVDVDSLQRPARARARLLYAARDVKVGLSSVSELDVKLPRREFGIASVPYTRKQLNEVFSAQMDRAIGQVVLALQVARLLSTGGSVSDIAGSSLEALAADIDVVVLSGGMSQVPYVTQRLSQLFPSTTSIEPACPATENGVALGLARSGGFGRVNKYRPAFDIVLEWDQGREERTVYAAFTPLLEQKQLARGGELRFVRDGDDLKLPASGKGRLRLVSHGDPVSATIGGAELDGFEVAWAERDFEFAIYPDGRLHLADANAEHVGQLAGWR